MRSVVAAYVLWFFFGLFGAHRFYCGRVGTGILWALTGGCFVIGWIVDAFLIPEMVDDCNREYAAFHSHGAGYRNTAPEHGVPIAATNSVMHPPPEVARGNRVVFCTHCGGSMQVPRGSIGSAYACPSCGTVLRVPA